MYSAADYPAIKIDSTNFPLTCKDYPFNNYLISLPPVPCCFRQTRLNINLNIKRKRLEDVAQRPGFRLWTRRVRVSSCSLFSVLGQWPIYSLDLCYCLYCLPLIYSPVCLILFLAILARNGSMDLLYFDPSYAVLACLPLMPVRCCSGRDHVPSQSSSQVPRYTR